MISKIAKTKRPEVRKDSELEAREKIAIDVLVIAQELKIIRSLASNDLSERTRQLKKLRRWLSLRGNSSFPFTPEDFLRIWKGLYYTMWMSDKPLIQEALAEDLGKLIDCFNKPKVAVQFFSAFLQTMCREWFGVDQWRMDKFLMLIRRMVRYIFRALKEDNWSSASVKEFNTHVFDTVLAENTSGGITMHFMDVFFEELAKVSDGKLTARTVGLFVKPFVKFMAQQHDFKIIGHCRNRIFHHLLYQSKLGREYTEKYMAWKEMGFPTESIDDLEKIETPTEDEGEAENETEGSEPKPLDPRAGNVDVYIPLLPLDGKYVVREIESLFYKEETSPRSRKILKDILEKYKTYQAGKFPLGVQTMPKLNLKSEKPLIKSKVEAIDDLENDMYSITRKLKQLNKRNRRKFLGSLNFTEADEDTMEKLIERSIPKDLQNDVKAKKRKSLSCMSWVEEEAEVSPSKIQKIEEQSETSEVKSTPKKQKKNLADDKQLEAVPDTTNVSLPAAKAAKKTNPTFSEWDHAPEDGEIQYFITSRKLQVKNANKKLADLVLNPFAKLNQVANSPKTPKNALLGKKAKKLIQSAKLAKISSPLSTPAKRVKIVLHRNTIQKPSEYIKQIKSSPNVPYDAEKKPSKGLLKPNAMPSPINPFYKKKIGLKFYNQTR